MHVQTECRSKAGISGLAPLFPAFIARTFIKIVPSRIRPGNKCWGYVMTDPLKISHAAMEFAAPADPVAAAALYAELGAQIKDQAS